MDHGTHRDVNVELCNPVVGLQLHPEIMLKTCNWATGCLKVLSGHADDGVGARQVRPNVAELKLGIAWAGVLRPVKENLELVLSLLCRCMDSLETNEDRAKKCSLWSLCSNSTIAIRRMTRYSYRRH